MEKGLIVEYWQNGKIYSKRNFANGKEFGVSKYYDARGLLERTVEYKSNNISVETYFLKESYYFLRCFKNKKVFFIDYNAKNPDYEFRF